VANVLLGVAPDRFERLQRRTVQKISARFASTATVYLRTRLTAITTLSIGWIAVDDPPHVLPPEAHEQTGAIQEQPRWLSDRSVIPLDDRLPRHV